MSQNAALKNSPRYRIVKMKSGRYALQSKGWLWGWNYFRYIMSEDIALWDTLEQAQERLDRAIKEDLEESGQIAEVVKEV